MQPSRITKAELGDVVPPMFSDGSTGDVPTGPGGTESLRAFDVVYILGGGVGSKPGMELLSLLITDNIVGESSHIGYGSALAVVLLVVSLTAIGTFLVQNFRKEDQ